MVYNGIALLDAIAIYGEPLTVQATPVSLGSSRHTSNDDWLRIEREIIGLIIAAVNFS